MHYRNTFLILLFGILFPDYIWAQIDPDNARVIYYPGPTINEAVVRRIADGGDLPSQFAHNITHLYIHGFRTYQNSRFVEDMINAYLSRGDINILSIDWGISLDEYNAGIREETIKLAETLGSQLAQMLLDMFNNGLDRASLHLVGDSLGGQEVGLIGREVKRLSNGTQSIAKITALDPLLMGYENRTSVSTEDGDFVSVIHTNEGIYGLPVPRGHADFCPNGGIIQPGWMNQDEFMGKNFYSHRIAAIYWRESVEDEAGPQFWAFRAGSYGAYLAADPRQLNETAIEMGINTPSTARGQYYLRTNGEYPYARGFQDAVRNYGNNP